MHKEKIKFQFWFDTIYEKAPPYTEIYIDDVMKFSGLIKKENPYVEFYATLDFSKHQIRLSKTGNLNGKAVSLIINKLKIDEIDVRNFIWHNSTFKPNYNPDYLKQNPSLESEICGELFLGHNGVWTYNFESPFYKFIVKQVRGQ